MATLLSNLRWSGALMGFVCLLDLYFVGKIFWYENILISILLSVVFWKFKKVANKDNLSNPRTDISKWYGDFDDN